MIELNLLPDVKQEYMRAERSKRLVISIALLISLGSVGLLVLLLSFSGLQSKHLSDLNKDIAKDAATLKAQPNIDRVLTVQNQLQSLTDLHNKKPASQRLFSFLNQVTPSKVSITSFTIDFTQQTVTIDGTADSLSSVNKFVDTLKYTGLKSEDGQTAKAFSGVVLSSFSVSGSGEASQAASYSITLKYDPAVFDNTKKTELSVPSLTTTHATVGGNDLFITKPQTTNKQGN